MPIAEDTATTGARGHDPPPTGAAGPPGPIGRSVLAPAVISGLLFAAVCGLLAFVERVDRDGRR